MKANTAIPARLLFVNGRDSPGRNIARGTNQACLRNLASLGGTTAGGQVLLRKDIVQFASFDDHESTGVEQCGFEHDGKIVSNIPLT